MLGVGGASTLFALALARFRPEFDANRHARRADRDGRFSQHPAASVASAANHARDRDHSGGHRHRSCTAKRHGKFARPQPGHSEPATQLRGLSAGLVHQRQSEDGRVREPRRGASRSPGSIAVVIALAQRLAPRANCARVGSA